MSSRLFVAFVAAHLLVIAVLVAFGLLDLSFGIRIFVAFGIGVVIGHVYAGLINLR